MADTVTIFIEQDTQAVVAAVEPGTDSDVAIFIEEQLGGGDMRASMYDPAGIEDDAFDLGFHYGNLENAAAIIDGGLL